MVTSPLQEPQVPFSPSVTARSSSSLAALTLAAVTERLRDKGSILGGECREAIQALLEAFEAGLTGSLPKAYHLSAIDPGVGKTLSVATFLHTWKAQGFTPGSSVLIGLSRLQEIDAFLAGSGLAKEDVAVLTSDTARNDLGVHVECHGTARVMFTTQQMIERRTRGRTFAQASEFHFEGAPRQLRIWDESLIPARPLVLSMDQLTRVASALRSKSPELSVQAQAVVADLWATERPDWIVVPEGLAKIPRHMRHSKDTQVAEAIETLRDLAGQTVTVVDGGEGNISIAGASQPLPSDFSPVIILDASGRVRSTYRVWEEAGGPLRRLPSATKDYSALRVHLWERSVGQLAMGTPGAIEDIAKALAEVIDGDAISDWLIVSYKAHPVEKPLRDALKLDPGYRLHFLTWGMHHATNEFVHCKRVVLIGQLIYDTTGYRALAAACGSTAEEVVGSELRAGEYRHHLLQALTRGSVRETRNGVAANCRAYLIASPNVEAYHRLLEVFPGCTIERWAPDVPEVGGRAGQLIALLEDGFAQKVKQLAKKDLLAALNMKAPNLARLLREPQIILYMARRHLWVDHSAIVFPPGFSPYPGGGFTLDQLEVDDLAGVD
jgi:hypothetical protein